MTRAGDEHASWTSMRMKRRVIARAAGCLLGLAMGTRVGPALGGVAAATPTAGDPRTGRGHRVRLVEADADTEQITAASPLHITDVAAGRGLTLPAGTTGVWITRTSVGQWIDVSTGGRWLPLRQPPPPTPTEPVPHASAQGAAARSSSASPPVRSGAPRAAGSRVTPSVAPTAASTPAPAPTPTATPTSAAKPVAPATPPRVVISGPQRVSAGGAALALIRPGGAVRHYAGDLTVRVSAGADPWSQAAGAHLSVIDTVAMSAYLRGVVPAAIRTTAGEVCVSGGEVIDAQFGASNGGYTAASGTPYLPAKPDRYDHAPAWTQRLSASDVARRYPQVGRLHAVQVTARDGHGGYGGRVTALRLIGTTTAGRPTAVTVRGADAVRLGMPSSWWAPPPAPAGPGAAPETTTRPCPVGRRYCTSID